MAPTTRKSEFLRGCVVGLPFVLVIIPFGALFGVVATEAGMGVPEIMGFAVLVIAGAAQFTALQLMTENAPIMVVLATALAVNLRMAMYSASLVPWLGQAPLWQRAVLAYLIVDQTYACSLAEYEAKPRMSVAERVAFFFGVALPIVPLWYAATLGGALLGARIPEAFALDFALPITFIALLSPMLRTAAHFAAAGVSVILALALAGLPAGVGLLIAGLCAMLAGAAVEMWTGRRT